MLTILIPSYNHENFILECLDASTNVKNVEEIIVIDDSSIDNTSKLVKEYISEHLDINIKLIEKKNGGLVSSLILGLSIVATDLLYIVASDDIPNSVGIKECVNVLIENPQLQFVMGGGRNIFLNAPATPIYKKQHELFFSMSKEERSRQLFLNYPSPILLQATIFRTNCLRAIGGWNSNLILDDYPIFIKLFTQYPNIDKDFKFMPESDVVFYRHHEENSYKNIKKQFFMVRRTLEELAPSTLKNEALGNITGWYFLSALVGMELSTAFSILNRSSIKILYFSFFKILKIILFKALGSI